MGRLPCGLCTCMRRTIRGRRSRGACDSWRGEGRGRGGGGRPGKKEILCRVAPFRLCCGFGRRQMRRTVKRRIYGPRFEPYSVLALALLGKGGGKPPHSKVGWRRVGWRGYASVWVVRVTPLVV